MDKKENKKEKKSLSGPIELLQKSWKAYKDNATTLTLVFIPSVILELILQLYFAFTLKQTSGHSFSSTEVMPVVIFLILFLIYILISFWSYTTLYLSIVEKSSDWKKSYHKSLKRIIPFCLVNILTGILVVGGLILFIIPGIIFYVWCKFASFVYFEQHKTGFSAIAKSKEYVKGYWWAVFLRGLFMFVIVAVVGIFFNMIAEVLKVPDFQSAIQSVIELVLTPLTILYTFEMYRELKAIHSRAREPKD